MDDKFCLWLVSHKILPSSQLKMVLNMSLARRVNFIYELLQAHDLNDIWIHLILTSK